MSIALETLFKIWEVCDAEPEEPLVSLVFPAHGRSRQIFLAWRQGRMLKEYLRDPALQGEWTLYQAAYSRIVDQMGIRRRLSHIPQPGDEYRFFPGGKGHT